MPTDTEEVDLIQRARCSVFGRRQQRCIASQPARGRVHLDGGAPLPAPDSTTICKGAWTLPWAVTVQTRLGVDNLSWGTHARLDINASAIVRKIASTDERQRRRRCAATRQSCSCMPPVRRPVEASNRLLNLNTWCDRLHDHRTKSSADARSLQISPVRPTSFPTACPKRAARQPQYQSSSGDADPSTASLPAAGRSSTARARQVACPVQAFH